jgi:hypothetical protein
MRQETKNVVNFASAANGRVLITDNEIRISFGSKEQAMRFLEAITELHPNLSLKTCALWRNIDIRNPEAHAA